MKSSLVHGALAAAGLVAAYLTWTREEEQTYARSEVAVVDCPGASFERVRVSNDGRSIDVKAMTHQGDPIHWITTKRKLGPGGEPKGATHRVQSFLANEKFQDLLKRYTPLRALRSLGKIGKEELKEFGLDKPEKKLVLTCGGKKYELEIGAATYGAGNNYARRPSGQTVYLLPSAVVRELEGAEWRFMQKQLHAFESKDVDEVRIVVQGKERRLLQRNRLTPGKSLWVDAAAPDRRNELFGNWLAKVARLSGLTYVALDGQPGSDLTEEQQADQLETAAVAEVSYFLKGKQQGKLQMVRVRLSRDTFYYAKTEATRTWVQLPKSISREVSDDAAMVVGLEQQPASQAGAQPPKSTSRGAAAKTAKGASRVAGAARANPASKRSTGALGKQAKAASQR